MVDEKASWNWKEHISEIKSHVPVVLEDYQPDESDNVEHGAAPEIQRP